MSIQALFLFAWLITLAGCVLVGYDQNKADEPLQSTRFLMDTIVSITVYNNQYEESVAAALDYSEELEKKLSRTIEGSDIYNLNHANGAEVAVSDVTLELLGIAREFSERSDGDFDITICPASELWDFTGDSPALPDASELKEAVTHIDYHNVIINGDKVTLKNGAKVDLGAIAKGYITAKAADFLKERNVESAILNFGGNIVTIGAKADGDAGKADFTIGIRKPFSSSDDYIATVKVKDLSVVTSGTYERYFELDGKNYHHILDPRTGYPKESGVVSVTIISDNSTKADALSTAAFIKGAEKGMALIESYENTEAVFLLDDGSIIYSKGLSESGEAGKIPLETE